MPAFNLGTLRANNIPMLGMGVYPTKDRCSEIFHTLHDDNPHPLRPVLMTSNNVQAVVMGEWEHYYGELF